MYWRLEITSIYRQIVISAIFAALTLQTSAQPMPPLPADMGTQYNPEGVVNPERYTECVEMFQRQRRTPPIGWCQDQAGGFLSAYPALNYCILNNIYGYSAMSGGRVPPPSTQSFYYSQCRQNTSFNAISSNEVN